MSTTTLNTRLAAFRAWLERSSLGGISAQAVSSGVAPFQQAAILLPGETLEIPHATDTQRLRIISMTETALVSNDVPLIPEMTCAISPVCTISSSSEVLQGEAWRATGETMHYWFGALNPTAWWRCQFNEEKAVHSYAIAAAAGGTVALPASWQFRGSHDGVSWETLDTQENVDWRPSYSVRKDFTLKAPARFAYYEIFITSVLGSNIAGLFGVQFYEWQSEERVFVTSPLDYEIELQDGMTRVKRITPWPQQPRAITATVRL